MELFEPIAWIVLTLAFLTGLFLAIDPEAPNGRAH